MRGARPGLFALMALLGTTIMVALLLAGVARADCGGPVSKYGQCTYEGDLLVCGTCALHYSKSDCDRCGAGYLCQSKSCAVLSRCAEQYTCDLCGCSWGPPTRPPNHRARSLNR